MKKKQNKAEGVHDEGGQQRGDSCVSVCVFERVGSEAHSDSRASALCVRVKSVGPEKSE